MSSPISQLHRAIKLDGDATKALIEPNSLLSNALTNSKEKGLPAIHVAPLAGQYLALQIKLMGAKSVLEIGTLGGYSSIWFAQAGAKVTSIEISPKHRDVALENTRGLDVDIILGAALDVLPKLAVEGRKFDFVFLDASWDEQWQYFDWAIKLTRAGGAIYVDNVVRTVTETEGETEGETLIDKVGKEKRVDATLVSTISSHKTNIENNIDGFILAVVKGE